MNQQQRIISNLREHYDVEAVNEIPEKKIKSSWTKNNKLGFLGGVVQYGLASHLDQLENILVNNPAEIDSFINEMYDCYIHPFYKPNKGSSSCVTPTNSRPPSRGAVEDSEYLHELTHLDLKKSVLDRDGVCLFCWDSIQLNGAHIIAQKIDSFAYDEGSVLGGAGLFQKHQIENGLLLCVKCHGEFDLLKRYVDFIEDHLVLKIVNGTNDENDVNWKKATRMTKASREAALEDFADNRRVEEHGEMRLYFKDDNPSKQPSRRALEFHKTACLIWRMAGAADPDEEYCSDCDSDDGYEIRAESIAKVLNDSALSLGQDFEINV